MSRFEDYMVEREKKDIKDVKTEIIDEKKIKQPQPKNKLIKEKEINQNLEQQQVKITIKKKVDAIKMPEIIPLGNTGTISLRRKPFIILYGLNGTGKSTFSTLAVEELLAHVSCLEMQNYSKIKQHRLLKKSETFGQYLSELDKLIDHLISLKENHRYKLYILDSLTKVERIVKEGVTRKMCATKKNYSGGPSPIDVDVDPVSANREFMRMGSGGTQSVVSFMRKVQKKIMKINSLSVSTICIAHAVDTSAFKKDSKKEALPSSFNLRLQESVKSEFVDDADCVIFFELIESASNKKTFVRLHFRSGQTQRQEFFFAKIRTEQDFPDYVDWPLGCKETPKKVLTLINSVT